MFLIRNVILKLTLWSHDSIEQFLPSGYWSALLPDRNVTSATTSATLASAMNQHSDVDVDLPLPPSSSSSSSASLETRNLLVAIMKDPSAKVRATAVAVVSYLLEGSKHYLAIADDHIGKGGFGGGVGGRRSGGSQMSFTPLSKTLAGTVHELHRTLLLGKNGRKLLHLLFCFRFAIPKLTHS